MKSSHDFFHFLSQRISISLIVVTVVVMGFGQPAFAAGIYDTYRSWSYYTDLDNVETRDDHYWSDESSWQGSSSVAYDDNNYAKSGVGFGNDGSFGAKIGVSVNNSLSRVYSSSYYRDDGFKCDGSTCGTAVPLGGSFETQLKQDGSFTLGSANYGLSYYLRTSLTAYNFHFAVQQGEMDLEPYGWFSSENLITGQQTVKDIANDPSFFNLVWEDNNDDGVYNFSYDFSFAGYTNGVDLGEELSVFAYASASSPAQIFDSYNSFHVNITPDAEASFYRSGQLVGNSVTPEPVSALLFGIGGAAMAVSRKRKKTQ